MSAAAAITRPVLRYHGGKYRRSRRCSTLAVQGARVIFDHSDSTKPEYVELESGLIVPSWVAEEKPRPKAVDLFCGCGGMSLGLMQGGMDVVAAVDNEPMAAETYMYNLGSYPTSFHFIEKSDEDRMEKVLRRAMDGEKGKKPRVGEAFISGGNREAVIPGVTGCQHFFLGDIRKLRGRDILDAIGLKRGELDCVAGGPPCQGFSTSGKQRVEDPRNSLVFEFARLVVELLPKTMVFENVPGIAKMVTPDGIPIMDQLCQILTDGGFSTVDALQQTLRARTGTFGAMRGQRGKKPVKPKPKKLPASDQRRLFRA